MGYCCVPSVDLSLSVFSFPAVSYTLGYLFLPLYSYPWSLTSLYVSGCWCPPQLYHFLLVVWAGVEMIF